MQFKIDNITFFNSHNNPTELSNFLETIKNKMNYITKMSINIRGSTVDSNNDFNFKDERKNILRNLIKF